MKQKYNLLDHEPCRSAPHAGQQLIVVDGFAFSADNEMAPLLRELNAAGLQTYSHCAGHSPDAERWVVLEADDVQFELRDLDGRKQLVLRWTVAEEGPVLGDLDFLERESMNIRCVSVPSGFDDYDIEWHVISHWQAEPHERIEGVGETPQEAITAAQSNSATDNHSPENTFSPVKRGSELVSEHASDCAVNNSPALPVGPCDCGVNDGAQ